MEPEHNTKISIACFDYIQTVMEKLPEVATTKDLIKVGIFSSEVDAFRARKLGYSPDYIQFPNRLVIYPREAIKEFLSRCVYSGSLPRKSKQE